MSVISNMFYRPINIRNVIFVTIYIKRRSMTLKSDYTNTYTHFLQNVIHCWILMHRIDIPKRLQLPTSCQLDLLSSRVTLYKLRDVINAITECHPHALFQIVVFLDVVRPEVRKFRNYVSGGNGQLFRFRCYFARMRAYTAGIEIPADSCEIEIWSQSFSTKFQTKL